MSDSTLKALEAGVGGTDLGAISVMQGITPVKIGKQHLVDASGNPIDFAALGIKGTGAAAAAQRVHLSDETLAALETISALIDFTKVNGAPHGAGNPLFSDVVDRIGRLLGIVQSQQNGAWTVGLDSSSLAALESISVQNFPANQGVNIASGPGSAIGNPLYQALSIGGAAPSPSNPVWTNLPPSKGVSITGAAAAAATLTIPAPAAGLFNYITAVEIVLINTAARATAAATLISVTSTNLGAESWSYGSPVTTVGSVDRTVVQIFDSPIKADAAATAVTLVAPATTGVQWMLKAKYYQAP